MICTHEWVRINDATKPRHQGAGSSSTAPVSWNGMIAGATVGCVRCGQIRAVYEDGEVRIVQDGGKPIDEDHEHSQP